MADVSVVIPAFKADFLHEALDSLVRQGDLRFEVVVADDASPHDLATIASRFADRLDLRYHRFESNLGGRDLPAQWDRAVAQANGDWILLLGDDDMVCEGAFLRLFEALESCGDRYDLFRFTCRKIDSAGKVIATNPDIPLLERSVDFIRSRFRGERQSFTCEYVFSRKAFDRLGGFVSFPLAWCSDDATWFALGQRGIRRVEGACSEWRLSAVNISARDPRRSGMKMRAVSEFIAWFERYLKDNPDCLADVEEALIRHECREWLLRNLWFTPGRIAIPAALQMHARAGKFVGLGRAVWLSKVLKHNLRRGLGRSR